MRKTHLFGLVLVLGLLFAVPSAATATSSYEDPDFMLLDNEEVYLEPSSTVDFDTFNVESHVDGRVTNGPPAGACEGCEELENGEGVPIDEGNPNVDGNGWTLVYSGLRVKNTTSTQTRYEPGVGANYVVEFHDRWVLAKDEEGNCFLRYEIRVVVKHEVNDEWVVDIDDFTSVTKVNCGG